MNPSGRGPAVSLAPSPLSGYDQTPVRFVYPEGDERPFVLLAGGVGCTPLMSLLRHALVSDPSRPITFLLSARTAKDIPFLGELSALARQHTHVKVGVTLTRENHRPGFRSGRIDEALLRLASPDPVNTLFYICGPTPMIDGMRRILSGLGVPADQIRWEVFEAAVAGAAETAVSDSGEGAQIHFSRKEVVREILRFTRGEMMLHWSIAVPFLVCFTTGIVLKLFYNLHSEDVPRAFLSFLHRVSGGALAVFPALAIARNWRDYKKHIYNIKVGFAWTIDDLKWLFLMGPATVSKRVVLPEQRKFNAAERLNFMMVMLTYPVFIVTGVLLWMPGNHFLPWVIHITMALVAPLLMFGHIYMAVVNPSTRVGLSGMFRGQVDREWAKHHYARWYREHFEEDGTPKVAGPQRADH